MPMRGTCWVTLTASWASSTNSALAYTQALTLNPDHLGALEYQGELFLQTGKPDLAKANLARIKGICGDCEESEDLEKAITAAGV